MNEDKVIFTPTRHSIGNTLSEYAFVSCLVLLICIGGFLTSGNNLNGIFTGLTNDMTAHRDVAVAAQASLPPAGVKDSSRPTVVSESPIGKFASDLNAQDLALLGKDLSDKLQTTGANGTTEILAKQLEVMAKQLLEEGRISQEESDAILRLANQGHHIAKIESLIEDAIRLADGDMNKLKQSSFTLDGRTYMVGELAEQIGFKPRKPTEFSSADILTAFPGDGSPEMEKFRQLYAETLGSSAMSDPAIRSTIQSAATQIAIVAEGVEDNMWAAVNKSNEYPIANVEEFNKRLAGVSTHMNSSKICTAGDYTDSGFTCSQ